METVSYHIVISAPKNKIWDVLWSPETYGIWTKFFHPDSHMKTDWQVGGKTFFMDSNGNGMVSTIESMDEPHSIVFQHLGTLKDGVEDTKSRDVESWSGAQEKYFLIALEDGTVKLQSEVQIEDEWKEMMDNGFTKGFQKVKELAEA